MFTVDENFVPKIHPATRNVEVDDPMELTAQTAPGDPHEMLDCFVQEFAWMGWDADQILGLFRSPFYPVLRQLFEYLGEDAVKERINDLVGATGILRFRETIVECDDEDEDSEEPNLVQITLPLDGPCSQAGRAADARR